jgi:hypothetical protein
MSVRLSIRITKIASHWMGFRENLYLIIFLISVEKIQISLKFNNNDGYFTWRPCWILLEMRCVSDISFRENRQQIICSITLSRKSCLLRDNVEKYYTAEQATYDNIIRRMRISFWIIKATDTHPGYISLLLSHGNNGYANARQCDVICTMSILFYAFLI